MVRPWQLHSQLEFTTKDAVATVATMTPDNYVNHVPVMTGGRGRDEVIQFYGKHFNSQNASRYGTAAAG
jgi:carboxymethylenebutenolidase